MSKYNKILFDLDGTISNSKEGITRCAQYALSQFHIYEEDLDQLEHFIGPPLVDEFMSAYGFSKEQAEKATEIYRERYEPIGVYEATIYPGVESMLKALKDSGKTIALATSKPQEMAEKVLKYFKISKYFDYIMGAERNGSRRNKTDVLLALFDAMNICEEDKKSVVLIGDTCFDVEGANNVGIKSIGVSYGFGNKSDMLEQGAEYVVDSTEELLEKLNEC